MTPGDGGTARIADAGWSPGVSPWVIALTVTMATFMEVLDTTIVNAALPHVAGSLAASIDESTWVLTSYLVSNAIVLPLSGWFSAIFGRKNFYMSCVALFTLASAACGFAPNLATLIVFRIIQGAAGGGLQPSEQAILVDTFPAKKRAMGMAVYGVAVVVAPILGPTLGGWLTDNYSWRWIFFINIPVGLLSLTLTSQLVTDPPWIREKPDRRVVRVDGIGLGLIAVGLGTLQVVLDKGEREDWFASGLIVACAVICVLGIAGAVVWEWRHRHPMVDLRLLKDRSFAAAVITMFMLGFALYGSTVLLPLFCQTLLGYDATLAGMVLSPGGLLVMVLMPLVGILLSKVQARWLVGVGLAIVGTSLLHMATFSLAVDFRTLVLARTFQASGLAFLFLPINTVAFDTIPVTKRNSAAGLINLARNLGGSAGIAFVTTMLSRRAQFHQTVLASHISAYDPYVSNAYAGLTSHFVLMGADPVTAAARAGGSIYMGVVREATMLAFVDDFWILGVALLVMVPLVLFMRRNTPGQSPAGMH